jgi:predicted N-acetyltransferase YhbS
MHRPDPNISLRSATEEDAAFVNNLTRLVMWDYVAATWPGSQEREAYFEKNKFELATTRIIQLEGFDVGRISVIKSNLQVLLDNIHVHPSHQSRGIG